MRTISEIEIEIEIEEIAEEIEQSANEIPREEICRFCGSLGPAPWSIHAKTCVCGQTQQRRWKHRK